VAWFDLGLPGILEHLLDRRAIRRIERLKAKLHAREDEIEALRKRVAQLEKSCKISGAAKHVDD